MSDTTDFKAEGERLDLDLLRRLALGSKRSQELQFLLDSQVDGRADYQALALALTDLSVPAPEAEASAETANASDDLMPGITTSLPADEPDEPTSIASARAERQGRR